MIFSLDHVVFAARPAERDVITASLEACGFEAQPFTLEFPEISARSDSWSFAGGGFVEFVTRVEGAADAAAADTELPWFDATPRIIGLGFASDSFEADTPWRDSPEGWHMDEHHRLPAGADLRIHAAGPHEHLSDFYVFVMDRPDGRLEFGPPGRGPHLSQISLVGSDARRWHANLAQWLGLPPGDGGLTLMVGDVTLAFALSDAPSVRASLTFESPRGGTVGVPLQGGAINVNDAG